MPLEGEINREHGAEREDVATRRGQHAANLIGDRARTSRGEAATIRRATSLARFFEPMKPASAVARIKNGNIAISTDSAMWLAIAQCRRR